MIEINQLSKKYDQHWVVNHVDALFSKGQATSIIGPNGAGKSTLISMISRLTKSDTGYVLIDKKPIEKWSNADLAKRLSILRQSNPITMRFSVRELVAFGRYPYSQGRLTAEDNRIINEALHCVNISHLQHQYIDRLSGGQRQMAFIAMVVAQDTDCIFLDEPLNNLDIKYSVDIMSTLQTLAKKEDKAIVIVIHDINFASCYSDQIIAMKLGKVVKSGSVEEVIRPEIMNEIYGIPFNIQEIDGDRISLYYKKYRYVKTT